MLRVLPNHIYKLHTTRSWDFLGVNHPSQDSLLTKNSGKGTIIGVIDTGKHSFSHTMVQIRFYNSCNQA